MNDVRTVTEADFDDWQRALAVGFTQPPVLTREQLDARRRRFVPGRYLGVVDGGRWVATLRSFEQELTVVGGGVVPADAVSGVTVSPTHRRRGMLSRMMAQDLAAARERGDVVATLIAAEYPIYGRFGFGPATWASRWTVEARRAGLDPRWSGPDDGGRIELLDAEEVRKLGPELYDRFRLGRPGAISRGELWWQEHTGALRTHAEFKEPTYALYRAASGEAQGLVSYTSDQTWSGKQPDQTASVFKLFGTTPAAERGLWHYLCSIDWVSRVDSGYRAPDDLLPLHLPDPRAARITEQSDWLWVRVLDVVRALEARTYDREGALVLEIADEAGFAAGRYRLDASPSGASCTPTTASADLALDVRELASAWLGGESLLRLAALGRVREEREGAARQADALFRSPGLPWCPDIF
ncbi:GNAT family N-acetyltransferase [Streptomyces misionensis]|uniref:GNAT family N-acetyltransferase n=1 Tax=Streptomyces misionensis TaxID=67331 RepID=A0A5C6JVW7_9ACTN|nr:GNAT family N-acetyltransferase [Streptomyces misionensis]TWV52832.1 GNAT family N-acetyltransferase [Streptomyces misionensis]